MGGHCLGEPWKYCHHLILLLKQSIQPSVSSRSCGANDYLKPLDWYDYMTIKHHYNIRTIILVKTIKKKNKKPNCGLHIGFQWSANFKFYCKRHVHDLWLSQSLLTSFHQLIFRSWLRLERYTTSYNMLLLWISKVEWSLVRLRFSALRIKMSFGQLRLVPFHESIDS